jgi:hypothetical protein
VTTLAKTFWQWVVGTLVLGLLFVANPAFAQTSGTGVLTGTVVDASSKKPAADVVVTATSPALQGEEVVVTDSSGFYRIPNLPPGVYTLRLEKEQFKPYSRPGIDLRSESTLRLNAELLPEALKSEEVVVQGRAPVVDVGSSSTGTTITKDFTSRVPVGQPTGKGAANRSFESVAEVTPGAKSDSYGMSVGGTTSLENSYLIDGMSVNNPGYGMVGTPLSTEFVKEVNVVSGGYMPEYGRATGGTLSVVTKSGSNEFHGGVFGYLSPGALEGTRKIVQPPVGTVVGHSELSFIGDVGADIGGPIIKDKLWFYAGVDFSKQSYKLYRNFYRTLTTDADGNALTTETIPGTEQSWVADATAVQAIAKLTYALNADNRISLTVIAAPGTSGGPGKFAIDSRKGGGPEVAYPTGTPDSSAHKLTTTSYDGTLKWSTEFSNKRVLIDTQVGWHHQVDDSLPADGSLPASGVGLSAVPHTIWNRNNDGGGFHPITDFEQFQGSNLCDPAGTAAAMLCPVTNYTTGGPGYIEQQTLDRYAAGSTLTFLFQGAGHHVIKAGGGVEITTLNHVKAHSGGGTYTERAGEAVVDDAEQYGVLTAPEQVFFEEPLRVKTRSLNAGGFLQDSWSVMDIFTLNIGIRYDTQQLYAADGHLGLSLPYQWSPRVGVIWDPTQEGRAKIFANYARYYENVPLAVNDLTLSGEPGVLGAHNLAPFGVSPPPAGTCDPTRPPYCQQDVASRVPHQAWGGPSASTQYFNSFGAGSTPIDPNIQASSSDEIVAGGEYEVLKDARLGASYTRRWMGRWIEDMSRDNLQTYILANPGYGIATDFPKAERTYDAVTLYFMKTFADDWLTSASWTISYLRGNLSGLYNTANDELNPNHNADYDSKTFTVNRYGPLPGDHTHEIKIFGAKDWVLNAMNRVMTGLAFRAHSGEAINYWGNHVYYGEKMHMLLPRGSGGRTPWIYDVDANIGYRYNIDKDKSIGVTVDIFNLVNFQEVTSVDDNYTSSNAMGVQNGTLRDVVLTDTGEKLTTANVNPNFKAPNSFQDPRVFRFGIRGTF